MKNFENPEIDELYVCIVEYAFTKWLVRRKISLAFKANFCRDFGPATLFQDNLRARIRHLFVHPRLGIENLVSSSFPFALAPEGSDFWHNQSEAWRRFYADFRKNL